MLPIAILCGGLAKRLNTIASQRPKALLPIAGKPFLHHQLALLRNQGIREIVLCVGHYGEQIIDSIGDGTGFGLSVKYSQDGSTPLGTGGAIRKALPLLGQKFFVMYGDSYLRVRFRDVLAAYNEQARAALMTVYENANAFDASNVLFENGEILSYSKLTRTSDMRHIDYGLGILSGDLFSIFTGAFDLASVYEFALERKQLGSLLVKERFYEIGSPRGMAETESFLESVALNIAGG